jgi:hypothetical protein
VIQVAPFLCASSLANDTHATMVPAKLKHLSTNHTHVSSENADYFKWRLKSKNKLCKAFVSKVTVSVKAQEGSYLVAELIAQKKESQTAGENLIMPACKIIVVKCWDKMRYEKLKMFHFQTV